MTCSPPISWGSDKCSVRSRASDCADSPRLSQQHSELVTAQARHQIGVAQPPREHPQHFVAHAMPVGVVHHLEVVHINERTTIGSSVQRLACGILGFAQPQPRNVDRHASSKPAASGNSVAQTNASSDRWMPPIRSRSANPSSICQLTTPIAKPARTTQARISIFSGEFHAYAQASTPSSFLNVGDYWSGYPVELRMSPGKYVLMVRCDNGKSHAFPTMPISLSAGFTYEVSCTRTGADDRKVRAGVSKTYPTEAAS